MPPDHRVWSELVHEKEITIKSMNASRVTTDRQVRAVWSATQEASEMNTNLRNLIVGSWKDEGAEGNEEEAEDTGGFPKSTIKYMLMADKPPGSRSDAETA